MKPLGPRIRNRQITGFSLVEVLVGMAIALIGIVIMFQVMENADTRKRTTAAGGDAQVSGSIAMYNLERDIRLAGNGFGSASAATMGCNINAYDTARAATFTFPLAPVLIVNGAAGAPDQLVVLYGNSASAPIDQSFSISTTTSKKMASTSSRGGLRRGDLVLVTSGATCGMVEITDNTDIDQLTVNHATGNYTNALGLATIARFNDPAGFSTASGLVFHLGNRDLPRRNIWQIVNRRTLTVTDDLHLGAAAEIGEGIINLQAQYGLDTTSPRDYIVDTWQTAAPANWTQLVAVRVALLARSQQYEKAAIPNYATCPVDPATDPATCQRPAWAGGIFTMLNLDGTADTNPDSVDDWRHYRYRIYETTIPLRNMIWGTAP
ncbi:MAG: PilW family protein [Gammaproteobacteria bacterium]|nr:PilW family protein [Gammaproteobacteria bacterium]MBU1647130.1 PilW family protein [Gammaproteobacteria bacterium]MBU1972642.1 PilW family protein [Gammaproteobacteria bacterium]